MGDNIVGHGLVDYVFVFSMMLYAYWAGQTKPHRILFILPACLSCFFFLPFGSNLTADKLVPAIFIISVILSKGVIYFSLAHASNNSWIGKVWLMISIAIIIGIFYSNFYSNYVKSPLFNTRLLVQVVSYINIILIFIITRKECTKPKGSELLLKSFGITTTLLCLYGVYQYFAHQFGWSYRGIVYSESKTGFGGFQDKEDLIFRVNSLANEPKRLTYFLVITLIILFKYQKEILKKTNSMIYIVLILLHAIVLWLTYSTSIYVSIAVFILFLMLYVVLIKYNKALFQKLLLLILVGGIIYFYQNNYINNIYESRVETQLNREEIRAEVWGQEFILKYPSMFILGIGPGNYNFALAKEYPGKAGLAEHGTFLIPFNSGLMTYLFDFGIIGFLLLFFPFFQILFNSNTASKNEFSIFVIFIYCTAITLNPSVTLFFFIGAFEGVKYIKDEY